jgi:uncharacterized protein (TIGR02145 family)
MKKFFLVAFLGFYSMALFSQRPAIELAFTAVNNAAHVRLDSIKVMNQTQGSDTVLYWPDTVLSIYYTGIQENVSDENAFRVFQNYPNPVADQTTISLYVPAKDNVSILVTDILGRMIVRIESVLGRGKHSFRFTPGSGNLYFFTARWQGQSSTIKILHSGLISGGTSTLAHIGSEDTSPQLKAMKDIQSFSFTPGDELLYIGYADVLQSGMLDAPEESQTCTFQFATNIPCPGTPTVEYEGQLYNTIQIFSQCWLKENLNVGTIIDGTIEQSNNATIEKYCYNNEPDSCTKYGGLYQWDEMMQYTSQQGTQGICPPGWHLPKDEEWKVLEGSVDSLYGIGHNFWNEYGYRGTDVGKNLKTTSGWTDNGNGTDRFGFSCLPAGIRFADGDFRFIESFGFYWSSTAGSNDNLWYRIFDSRYPTVDRIESMGEGGLSVRCLRDD